MKSEWGEVLAEVCVKGDSESASWVCQFQKHARLGMAIRCGGCAIGLITPKVGARCKHCKRAVVSVRYVEAARGTK